MTGHTVYDKCKSRELIKIGVSTSYNEVLKSKKKLSVYVLVSSINEGPPLPSHFSPSVHLIHADRSSQSGTHSDHDTAVVMFQVKPVIEAKCDSNEPAKFNRARTSLPKT